MNFSKLLAKLNNVTRSQLRRLEKIKEEIDSNKMVKIFL